MGESLKKCEKCNRMFAGPENITICSRCMSNDDGVFRLVREFVYDNPGCNIMSVAEGTGVPEEVILSYVKQGRLELKGEGVGYGCDKCGANITHGKYCDKCAAELARDLRQASELIGKPSMNLRDSEYRVKTEIKTRR